MYAIKFLKASLDFRFQRSIMGGLIIMFKIIKEGKEDYKEIYFGTIIFRLENEDDIKKAKEVLKDSFKDEVDYGKDGLNFDIEGGIFRTRKTSKSVLLKYYGGVGSFFYEWYFRDLIKGMKSAGIEIKYIPNYSEIRKTFGNEKIFYDLENDKLITDYINN